MFEKQYVIESITNVYRYTLNTATVRSGVRFIEWPHIVRVTAGKRNFLLYFMTQKHGMRIKTRDGIFYADVHAKIEASEFIHPNKKYFYKFEESYTRYFTVINTFKIPLIIYADSTQYADILYKLNNLGGLETEEIDFHPPYDTLNYVLDYTESTNTFHIVEKTILFKGYDTSPRTE